MDFWTSFPYWGILLLVAINALIVVRRGIKVEDREGEELEH
jgi:hypothetical protein